MQFAGIVPEDAPDPRIEAERAAAALPVAVRGLVPQATLEDGGLYGITSTSGAGGVYEMSVSISYTLWRNPADRSDPVNLAELDEVTRRSLDEVPPWPRPAWLVAAAERLRYPMLWEAVRTTWHRQRTADAALAPSLVHHARHVVMNRFRDEAGIERHGWDSAALPRETAVHRGVPVRVDGVEVTGAEIDTDPFVYAVGAELADGAILTAVVPRDDLPAIDLAFATRAPGLHV